MKYAFFPGCVSRGGCPELYPTVVKVCQRLGIELDELTGASCTGAGVLQEKDQLLGDTLNARTFAMAEQRVLPVMTICSTCQGVMSQANERLKGDPEYLAQVNENLKEEGLEYKGTAVIKHLLWILAEDVGVDNLKAQFHSHAAGPETGTILRVLHSASLLGNGVRPVPRPGKLSGDAYRSGGSNGCGL